MIDETLPPKDDSVPAAAPEPQAAPPPQAAAVPEETAPEPQADPLPQVAAIPEETAPEPQAAPPPQVAAVPEEPAAPPAADDFRGQPASPQDFAAPPPPPSPNPQSYSAPAGAVPLSVADERTWSMLAHLSVLTNLLGIPFGLVIALIIYFVFRERSRYVAYQSLQAFIFQLVWWGGGGLLTAVAWGVSSVLAAVLIGLCLMPFACLVSLMPIVALVYGVVAAVETSQGRDFRYWLIGDWVRDTLTGA